MIDISGQKFGKWLVIKRVEKPVHLKQKDVYYECHCDCGTVRVVKSGSLKSGRSKSCGCPGDLLDLLNHKFGQLTVIGSGYFDNHVIFYPCRCECLVEVNVRLHDLSRKDGKAILSCGHTKIHSDPKEAMYSTARMVYRDTYNDGDLTFNQFLELSQLQCHYCGSVPKNSANVFKKKLGASDFAVAHGTFIYSGLDRLDNTYPHNLNNVVPCCIICNWAKSKMNYEDFLIWVTSIYKYRIEK